ncbi:hypothetical protein SAMD00019534_102120 [Acytostelium subglobosum LB1]|uniref:hypothetical protein n=1 Tax=Acytostelium subglobosum LB1 TaxID=1410327 RepID=UPI000644F795|nr:hypothetical protein SAMD00019534_102120 [Acytostelium subglobosum LB1]GAM27037.1 hypothetical protein SAMD00019534_102120 [Acytostelium subglobosum LB1]|eukprot:XP_012749917.1 hypothetical protein SAMD00019534_102120 [Acytostelium subglobosum LB1]
MSQEYTTDIEPGTLIEATWSWGLILASYLVSVMGSYTYFQVLDQYPTARGWMMKELYLALASITLGGCAIWSMHFIGMMACGFPIPISYDITITVLSGLAAIVAARLGLVMLTNNLPAFITNTLRIGKPLIYFQQPLDMAPTSSLKNSSSSEIQQPSLVSPDCISMSNFMSPHELNTSTNSLPPDPFSTEQEVTMRFLQSDRERERQRELSDLNPLRDTTDTGSNDDGTHSQTVSLDVESLIEDSFAIDLFRDEMETMLIPKPHQQWATYRAFDRNLVLRLTFGALFMAIGIFSMHYSGMSAMRMNAVAHYNMGMIVLSFIFAWIASALSLYISLFGTSSNHVQHLMASLVMAMAVCLLHYTGMFAVTYHYMDMGYDKSNSNLFIAFGISMFSLILCFLLIGVTSIAHQRVKDKLLKLSSALTKEKMKSDSLINSIFPSAIISRMKQGDIHIAEECPGITIIFADIVDFTQMAPKFTPKELVTMLNRLYSLFDDLSESMNLEKIKTIGDSYMIVSGLKWHCVDYKFVSPDLLEDMDENDENQRTIFHANKAVIFASKLLEMVEYFNQKYGYDLHLRIGIHTGDAIAGIIGKKRYSFDIWGDAVNIASRMESSGFPNKICVSESTFSLLKRKSSFQKYCMDIKGKGNMDVYVLDPIHQSPDHSGQAIS